MLSLEHVPTWKLPEIWPKVEKSIYSAIRRGDFSGFHPVASSVLNGLADLWIVMEDDSILAAVVTEYTVTETRKICTIVACGGRDMPRWLHLIRRIEAKSKVDGCHAVRIIGRTGWMRVLDYPLKRVVLEKELRNGRL